MSFPKRIGNRLRAAWRYRHVPMTKLSGAEKTSSKPLSVLYAGTASQLPYIRQLFFSGKPTETAIGAHPSWLADRVGRRHDCQLVTVIHPATAQYLLPRSGYVLPLWVTSEADTSTSPFETRCKSLKKDLRRIKRFGLECEFSTSPDDMHFFWQRMYLPYICTRHADRAILGSREDFCRQVDAGEMVLFFVTYQGRRVGGSTISLDTQIPRSRHAGLLDGDLSLMRIGVPAALYVFELDWAHRHGYKKLNLGGNRPFLKDGVLQFKKKFNISLMSTGFKKVLFIRDLVRTEAVTSSLVSNPFFRLDNGRLVATIFESDDCECETPDSLCRQSGEVLSGVDHVERVPLN